MIRPAETRDAGAIAAIYNHYVMHTLVTFEEQACSVEAMAARIRDSRSMALPWLVAQDDAGCVVGYAYASRWGGRCSYRHSLEITVYLAHQSVAQGWGSRLYQALFAELAAGSTHVLIAGIALPNPESIALHEKFGMEKVAHFKEVGRKMGQWVDVAYWQVTLDDG